MWPENVFNVLQSSLHCPIASKATPLTPPHLPHPPSCRCQPPSPAPWPPRAPCPQGGAAGHPAKPQASGSVRARICAHEKRNIPERRHNLPERIAPARPLTFLIRPHAAASSHAALPLPRRPRPPCPQGGNAGHTAKPQASGSVRAYNLLIQKTPPHLPHPRSCRRSPPNQPPCPQGGIAGHPAKFQAAGTLGPGAGRGTAGGPLPHPPPPQGAARMSHLIAHCWWTWGAGRGGERPGGKR